MKNYNKNVILVAAGIILIALLYFWLSPYHNCVRGCDSWTSKNKCKFYCLTEKK